MNWEYGYGLFMTGIGIMIAAQGFATFLKAVLK